VVAESKGRIIGSNCRDERLGVGAVNSEPLSFLLPVRQGNLLRAYDVITKPIDPAIDATDDN
jgi:hypothetical protein